jgi:DHA2 family multidrug resistance protein
MVSSVIQKQYPAGLTRIIIVTTCIVASLLELIDTTIVNVSLRHIAGSTGSSTTDVAWVITAYAISNVIIIPLSSMLTELFGRKRYFTFSIILFTFASFMCGNSGNLWELVFWRFVQGLGGGALLSLSQSILLDSFPPAKTNMATAIYGMGVSLGPALGPTLGGIITDNYSWHWVFFINVPLGIFAALAAWTYVSDQTDRKKPESIDWLGILLLSVGIGSLQYVLEEGNSKNWFEDKNIILLSIISFIGLLLFVIRELRIKNPAVNLSLFKSRNLSVGVFLNFGMFAMMFIGIYAFPLLAQIDLGWTATMTGIALVPGAIATTFGMAFCQRLIAKGVNPRNLIISGFIASFIFASWFTFQSPDSSYMGLFWPLLFRGISVGLYMLPAISLAIKGFSGTNLSQAVGLSNMARQLGGAVGLALIGNQILNSQAASRSLLISHVSDYQPAAAETINKMSSLLQSNGMTLENAHVVSYTYLNYQVVKQASLLSYLSSFRIMAVISIVALLAIFLTKSNITEKK